MQIIVNFTFQHINILTSEKYKNKISIPSWNQPELLQGICQQTETSIWSEIMLTASRALVLEPEKAQKQNEHTACHLLLQFDNINTTTKNNLDK